MPMPVPRKDILTALQALNSQPLASQKWGIAFFKPDGFVATPDPNRVALDWLNYADQIYLEDKALSQIIEEVRATNLGTIITGFIGVEDAVTRGKRQNAWNTFVYAMLGSNPPPSDGEKCRLILAKLTQDDYVQTYSLKSYNIVPQTVAHEETNSALKVMNVSLRQAFDFLTTRDPASVTPGLTAILYSRLVEPIASELEKKALVNSLLQHAYQNNMFGVLPATLIANLPPGQGAAVLDGRQNTISLTILHNHLLVTEQSLISISLDDIKELVVSECVISLAVRVNSNVAINLNSATTYSTAGPAIALLSANWRQKLTELSAYALHYIDCQRHDEKKLAALFRKYPEFIEQDSVYTCLPFFGHRSTAEVKGQKIFTFLGINHQEFVVELNRKLNYYAAKSEGHYTYAIKLQCSMGDTVSAKTALFHYLESLNPEEVLNDSLKFDEALVRRAYRFKRDHGVYLVFELEADMKFFNATVLTQYPARLLQFDHDGVMTELAQQLDLAEELPSWNKAYLQVYRFKNCVDYIKPMLDQWQLDELNIIIQDHDGYPISLVPDCFDYPDMSAEINPNIVKLDDTNNSDEYYKYHRRVRF
jgi:hypothetical protein